MSNSLDPDSHNHFDGKCLESAAHEILPTKVRYLLLTLSTRINTSQIESLRGAFIALSRNNILYHNHKDSGYAYMYPLVQYKRIGGHGAVLVIGKAIETVGKLLDVDDPKLQLGATSVPYEIERVLPGNMVVQVWNTQFRYYLNHWLPLNKENYEKYLHLSSVADKVRLMEQILTGNVLSMSKGLEITLTERVECVITQLSQPSKVRYKGACLMEFDVEFDCNVSIPDYFGLGKGASLGHGVCVRKKKDNVLSKE